MPKKYVKRRRMRKGKYVRRKEFVKRYLNPHSSNLGYLLPDKIFMKTPYCTQDTYSASGNLLEHVFAGNDLYDPDVTGGGNQPMLFDQMMALYNRFYVRASKISVTIVPNSSTPTSGTGQFVITPNLSSSNLTSSYVINTITEQDNAKWKVFTTANARGASQLTHFKSNKNMGGPFAYQDTDNTGTISSSPSQLWYWHVVISGFDGLTNLSVWVRFKIVYYVEYSGIKRIGSS